MGPEFDPPPEHFKPLDNQSDFRGLFFVSYEVNERDATLKYLALLAPSVDLFGYGPRHRGIIFKIPVDHLLCSGLIIRIMEENY